MEASLRGEKTFGHAQDTNGDWCLLQHLRGCCLLDQVQRGACGVLKERKISDAIRCFFRCLSSGVFTDNFVASSCLSCILCQYITCGSYSNLIEDKLAIFSNLSGSLITNVITSRTFV